MNRYVFHDEPATDENFEEAEYLAANRDVANAVAAGTFPSGRRHFERFGKREGRRLRKAPPMFAEAKRQKLDRIAPILRKDMPFLRTPAHFDFLTAELRKQFHILDTDAVSGHSYDQQALDFLERQQGGIVVDVGAGRRPIYFDHVVNFEIVDYDTTDVRGVSEALPFADRSVDGVICTAVLEHVKDPFLSAREISRVMKHGGEALITVPFLQPLHAYPHHYYNMTDRGLRNLFEPWIEVDEVELNVSGHPVFSLTWILRSWADGLDGTNRDEFLNLRVADLIGEPFDYLGRPFAAALSREKRRELAASFTLVGHKR